MTTKTRYWLLKSEADCFSFDDLLKAPRKTTCWSGVRNYQARNFMRDDMKVGDGVLFYHSNGDPSAIAGIAEVVKESYPDHTAWDAKDEHFDPKSSPDKPIWYMVDIKALKKLPRPLGLNELRKVDGLEKMELLRTGSRLSVQPVTEREWRVINKIAVG